MAEMNETLAISLAPGLQFNSGRSWAVLGATGTTPMPEMAAGSVEFSVLAQRIPHLHLALLPVVDSLAFAHALHHMSRRGLRLTPETHLHLDWPSDISNALVQMASHPQQAFLLARPETIGQGQFHGHGKNAAESGAQNPLLLLHATEPRRVLLQTIAQEPCPCIHSLGALSATVQWTFAAGRTPFNPLVPTELWLDHGWIPWLTALFRAPQLPDDSVSLETFLDGVLAAPESPHLLVASPELITALARELEARAREPDFDAWLTDRAEAIGRGSLKRLFSVPEEKWALGIPSARTLAELCPTPAFAQKALFSLVRSKDELPPWKDLAAQAFADAFQKAAGRYAEWTRMEIHSGQQRDFFRFVHRLARESERLSPAPFDILLAAQAVADGNFAHEMLKECESFSDDPTLQLPRCEVGLAELAPHVTSFGISRFETLQRSRMSGLRSLKSKKAQRAQKTPPPVDEGKYADGNWVREDHPYSCSFPEEDVFMEDFAFHCRDQAKETIRALESRSHELDSSLGDGLDLRTTLRHWHEERLFVFEEVHMGKADVGAVVFQFVEPDEEADFSWRSFWLAEKHDRGDLMFYATPFAQNIIGPGVAKSEFGGFAVIPIPNFLNDSPWNHPFIAQRKPSEALLVAAAASTDHRVVLFISPHAPGQEVSALLRRSGKTILHMHLDELPADKIRRLRTFHILAEAGVRSYAHKYIRKE